MNQLICLANMESLNSVMIGHGLSQEERLVELNAADFRPHRGKIWYNTSMGKSRSAGFAKSASRAWSSVASYSVGNAGPFYGVGDFEAA